MAAEPRGLVNIVIDLNKVGTDLSHLQTMGPDERNAQARLEILLNELTEWEIEFQDIVESLSTKVKEL